MQEIPTTEAEPMSFPPSLTPPPQAVSAPPTPPPSSSRRNGRKNRSNKSGVASLLEVEESDREEDRVVVLVVEAKRTHLMIKKIHYTMILLWVPLGLFHYNYNFQSRWKDYNLGVLDAASLLQNLWGVCFLMLVALRNDFPMNILAIVTAAAYFGFCIGIHAVRRLDPDAVAVAKAFQQLN